MILVVDDDRAIAASLTLACKQAGHRTVAAGGADEAMRALCDNDVALVIQDMNFSRATTGDEGLALLGRIKEARPEVPVILMTAWATIDLAVAGMKAGASDFLTKPWSNEHLLACIATHLDLRRSRAPSARTPTREALAARLDLRGIAGSHPKLLEVLEVVARVAPTDASVLITGESGTGKEAIAELLHLASRRAAGPLVKVNLGGIPPSLFESEMFGHARGAFTDASSDRKGRFEMAAGGTIFLDEIGDLPPSCQVKLLRVLQDRTFEPVGVSTPRKVDVRVVSATNRDLAGLVARGEFREDLLYRLNLITLAVPPLRERASDVPILAERFLEDACRKHGRPRLALTPEARAWLSRESWPGNVRELQHLIERAALLSQADALDVAALGAGTPGATTAAAPATIEAMERALIERSLEENGGNLTKVAHALGLSRPALYRRLEKHGIRP